MLLCQCPVNTYHISLSFTPGVPSFTALHDNCLQAPSAGYNVQRIQTFTGSCVLTSCISGPVRLKDKTNKEWTGNLFVFVTWFRLLSALLLFFLSVFLFHFAVLLSFSVGPSSPVFCKIISVMFTSIVCSGLDGRTQILQPIMGLSGWIPFFYFWLILFSLSASVICYSLFSISTYNRVIRGFIMNKWIILLVTLSVEWFDLVADGCHWQRCAHND